jgi:hypothetical protein
MLSNTLARAEQAAKLETIEVAGQKIDPRYRLSNARLIELLEVKSDEYSSSSIILPRMVIASESETADAPPFPRGYAAVYVRTAL